LHNFRVDPYARSCIVPSQQVTIAAVIHMSRSTTQASVQRALIFLILFLFGTIAPTLSLAASCLLRTGKNQDIGRVLELHTAGDGALLVGTDNGVFRREGDDLIKIGKDGGLVSGFYTAGGITLVTIEGGGGLRRRDGDNLIPIGQRHDIF